MPSYKIEGMTCAHCVRAVTQAIQQADPAATVSVDLAAGRADVSGGTADAGRIIAAVSAEGYAASSLQA